MEKDSNIRVFKRDRQLLRKIAKLQGRTLKVSFGHAVQCYNEFLARVEEASHD